MRTLLFKNLMRGPVTEAAPLPDEAALAELAGRVDVAAKRKLGRSLAIREVDAGSCNACELEIHALNNAFYDLERFGLRFVASPRHADVLMVTGPVTKNMREALERTYNATPGPKWVVAVGNCAADGGIFAGSCHAVVGGVDKVIPVDLHIKGCSANAHPIARRAARAARPIAVETRPPLTGSNTRIGCGAAGSQPSETPMPIRAFTAGGPVGAPCPGARHERQAQCGFTASKKHSLVGKCDLYYRR